MVDFHGAFKPTGLRRTYPNVLTREGVLGMEYSKSTYGATPEHDVRFLHAHAGGSHGLHAGCFNNATREQFKPREVEPMCQGTRAHQLAMYVVFESPFQMLSDYPESYDHPEFEFIDKVPTVWDDTKVFNGEPAKLSPSPDSTATHGTWAASPTGTRAIWKSRSVFWGKEITRPGSLPMAKTRIRSQLAWT